MLVLPATLTAREARDTLRMLAQAIKAQTDEVVVDAAGLVQFDSSALSVLLECQRQAKAWGKTFALREPPAKLIALAKLYGIDSLMMRSSEAAA
jgi:phospholipid transport system transporter-binding protein